MSADPMICKRMLVFGRVQGVSFRASTVEAARELRGFVQNLPDGSVEILASGPASRVNALFDWAKRGPPGARVDRFEIRDAVPAADFPASGFTQRR